MKQWLRKNWLISLSLLIGILASLFIYLNIPYEEAVDTIQRLDFAALTYFLLVVLIIQFILTYRWLVVIRTQDDDVNFFRLILYRLAGYSVSFLTPSAKMGGEPVRATILSQKERRDFDKSMSSVVIDKTIELSASGLFFMIGVIFLLFQGWLTQRVRIAAIVAGFIFTFLIIAFNYRVLNGKPFFHPIFDFFAFENKYVKKAVNKVEELEHMVIEFYCEEKKAFYYSLFLSLLSWFFMFIEFWLAALVVGVNLSLLEIFLVFSFVGLSYLFPIPMALGALEAGQISIFKLFGLSSAAAIGLAIIVRIKDVILSIIGIGAMVKYGYDVKEMISKSKELKDENMDE